MAEIKSEILQPNFQSPETQTIRHGSPKLDRGAILPTMSARAEIGVRVRPPKLRGMYDTSGLDT